jgi:hypothetical protein
MHIFIDWAKRIALAALILVTLYVATDHIFNHDQVSLGGNNNALTFGAAPGRGAGAELCTYFNTPPPVFTSSQLGQVRCTANQDLRVTTGFANNTAILIPTSPTVCTNISNSSGVLAEVVNANASPQPVTLSLFDDSAHSCASGSQIYQVILSSSASPILMIPLSNGLAYTLSGTPGANIVITYLK